MNKNTVVAVVVGLVIGAGGTLGVSALNISNEKTETTQQQISSTDHSSMSMADMNKALEGLTDDDFDKAFTEMMIAHHEGAVDMAELIPTRAKHEEVKTLGKAIVSAQTNEIAEMRQWQKDWGYTTDGNMMEGMDHSGH